MKYIYLVLIMPLLISAIAHTAVETEPDVSPTTATVINMPAATPTGLTAATSINPTRLSVIRDVCINNKGVVIMGLAGTISTTLIALVVHFTKSA